MSKQRQPKGVRWGHVADIRHVQAIYDGDLWILKRDGKTMGGFATIDEVFDKIKELL